MEKPTPGVADPAVPTFVREGGGSFINQSDNTMSIQVYLLSTSGSKVTHW